MKPGLDYTLYNKIKKTFPAQPKTILFVSITSENIDELSAIQFTNETFADFRVLVDAHRKNLTPYAAIGGFDEDDVSFYFACPEFVQEEDCHTGQILKSDIGTYNNDKVDLNAVKRDLQRLINLDLLLGNT